MQIQLDVFPRFVKWSWDGARIAIAGDELAESNSKLIIWQPQHPGPLQRQSLQVHKSWDCEVLRVYKLIAWGRADSLAMFCLSDTCELTFTDVSACGLIGNVYVQDTDCSITHAALSPDGAFLCLSECAALLIVDMVEQEFVQRVELDVAVQQVSWAADSSRLLVKGVLDKYEGVYVVVDFT